MQWRNKDFLKQREFDAKGLSCRKYQMKSLKKWKTAQDGNSIYIMKQKEGHQRRHK
jgi:hypothetical protein